MIAEDDFVSIETDDDGSVNLTLSSDCKSVWIHNHESSDLFVAVRFCQKLDNDPHDGYGLDFKNNKLVALIQHDDNECVKTNKEVDPSS